jgi:two-component sensor histidine kinase
MALRPTLEFSRPDLVAAPDRRIADKLSIVAGRVRDQASGLDGRFGPIDRDEVQAILAELGGRVDAVAHLLRLLAENPVEPTVSLGEYLQDIAAAVVAALSSDRVTRLQFACDPHCFVPPERALSLGFIVVELMTNAVKYAHPTGVAGEIRVGCEQRLDGTIIVEVSDDGVGLPEGMDPMKSNSLGLQIVRSLAAQLGARVGFAHNALGLSCVLQMPGELRA